MKPTLTLNCVVKCSHCSKVVAGTVSLDGGLTVCDSAGFLVAGMERPRIVCDDCCRAEDLPTKEEVVTGKDVEDPAVRERLAEMFSRAFRD